MLTVSEAVAVAVVSSGDVAVDCLVASVLYVSNVAVVSVLSVLSVLDVTVSETIAVVSVLDVAVV